jgi:hypothetical protein
MVPGGSESVTICATKPGGTRDNCTIANSDPAIAAASLSDSTIQITGVSYGTTNITVASGGNLSCTLPVQVYTPFVLDVGELLITLADSFTLITHTVNNCSFWQPTAPEGYNTLGSFGQVGNSDPNGHRAAMVVKARPGSDAIAFTDTFQQIMNCPWYGTGIYKPIAPPGYVAMGDFLVIVDYGTMPSPPDSVACIREDLTIPGETGTHLWDMNGCNYVLYSFWNIDQPNIGAHSEAHLVQGTFVARTGTEQPDFDPSMNVPMVDLPMLAEAPYQIFVPKMSSYDTPPEETVPLMAKAMLVPCSIVNDSAYSGNIGWQVANSPFYRLERQVYYKLLYHNHNHNQTSEIQTNNVTITSGITTTESERIWNETSISISVEAGLSFKALSGKITATVSRTFGYETQTSVAELQEKSISSSINTPPGKAAALWQKYNRYILYRHNGTRLGAVSSWEFGIDSYVTDEYPDN